MYRSTAVQWSYVRVHGHCGEFGVDVSAGGCGCVTGEGLRRRHLVLPTELQRAAAVHLFDLWQVRLRSYHHTWCLTIHEVLLREEREWMILMFFFQMDEHLPFDMTRRTVLPWRLWRSIQRRKGCWHHRPGTQCHRPDQHQTDSRSQETLREAGAEAHNKSSLNYSQDCC